MVGGNRWRERGRGMGRGRGKGVGNWKWYEGANLAINCNGHVRSRAESIVSILHYIYAVR